MIVSWNIFVKPNVYLKIGSVTVRRLSNMSGLDFAMRTYFKFEKVSGMAL